MPEQPRARAGIYVGTHRTHVTYADLALPVVVGGLLPIAMSWGLMPCLIVPYLLAGPLSCLAGALLAGANIQRRARQSSDRSADLLGLNALILVGVLFTAVAILPALPVLSVGWLDHERAHKWFRVVFELLLA